MTRARAICALVPAMIALAACEDPVQPTALAKDLSPRFTVTAGGPVDLGDFRPSNINNLGQVAGLRGITRPVLWTPSSPGAATGVIVDLPLIPNTARPVPGGVNDLGQVAGHIIAGTPRAVDHAVFWAVTPAGAMVTDLGGIEGCCARAFDINDAGQVVGDYRTPTDYHAYVWTPNAPGAATGTFVDIAFPPGPNFSSSTAYGVNNLGQVVGEALTPSEEFHAFLWTPGAPGASTGTMLDLGTLPGGSQSRALAINDYGQIAGSSDDGTFQHAVLWTVSGSGTVSVEDIDRSESRSVATGINNLGQVVGFHITRTGIPNVQRGFFWAPGEGMTFLNTLEGDCDSSDPTAVNCSQAEGINDRGEVAGISWTGSAFHATRWTMIVVPPTPVEQVEAIESKVKALVTSGALNQGQGNALTAKLDAAAKQLNKGNTKGAINLLQAFINQCRAFVGAGIITSADSQALIEAAQKLIDELSNGP